MAEYVIRFFFEYGCVGDCLWCGNDAAYSKFDVGPISFDKLNLSEKLKADLTQLSDDFQSSLDWECPSDPSPWTEEHWENFKSRANEVYDRLVSALGSDFEVINECYQ
ncbi:MAG: hypothetical protein K2K57_12590 [Oscillospiraceae bacterium]|nr:hypothetical protein [Oscillospiraceae bacterium]